MLQNQINQQIMRASHRGQFTGTSHLLFHSSRHHFHPYAHAHHILLFTFVIFYSFSLSCIDGHELPINDLFKAFTLGICRSLLIWYILTLDKLKCCNTHLVFITPVHHIKFSLFLSPSLSLFNSEVLLHSS